MFYLGTHQPHWLADPRCEGVPLFVSRRTLARYKRLPDAVTSFALDSGGFTELQLHGRWQSTAAEYAAVVRELAAHFGSRLRWVAPQDWMCEPIVLHGGKAGGVIFAGTGLTIEEHQRRTVANFVELRALLGDLVIPVLQGWKVSDYWRCEEMYSDAGVDLAACETVGVGSVCRRQAMGEAETIMRTIGGGKLRLHGFGFKKAGVERAHDAMVSADSTAWSVRGRRSPPLPGHDRPGPGRPRGHKNCANCVDYALGWRSELLAGLRRGQAQGRLHFESHSGKESPTPTGSNS